MVLPIFIPSRDRATAKNISSGPFGIIPDGHPVTYVVPCGQKDAYEALGVPVIETPPEVNNIGLTRQYIGMCAQAWGYAKFFMLDDDLRFFHRASDESTKLVRCDKNTLGEMINCVESHLDHYGQVGVSSRTGNNRRGVGPRPLLQEATRTNSCTAYQTDLFLRMEHNRVLVMEDFDVSLQILRLGIPTACFYYWTHDQSMTNAAGGCSVYRNHQTQHESAHELARLHAPFVTTRVKQNKTGGEFGTRTEVTIQWKKAYAEGQRLREETT